MKKIMEKIEDFDFTTREYLFIGAILFFLGLIIGLLVSPKGDRTIGCNNGANYGNNSDCLAEDTNDEQ